MFRAHVLVLCACVAAPALAPAGEPASEPAHPYGELDGRREGVLSRPEIEPGRKLSLFAIRFGAVVEPAADVAAPLRVAFWHPDSGEVQVVVREYASRYKMEMRHDLGTGPVRLEWPSAIARDCGLSAEQLLPLVATETSSLKTFCPAVVYGEKPALDGSYVFTFVSRVPVTLLDWQIVDSKNARIVASDTMRGVAKDKPFDVTWTPRKDGENPDPDGPYELFLWTTLQPQPGTPAAKVTTKYRFLHLPETFGKLFP
jgi:hypothetical protein